VDEEVGAKRVDLASSRSARNQGKCRILVSLNGAGIESILILIA